MEQFQSKLLGGCDFPGGAKLVQSLAKSPKRWRYVLMVEQLEDRCLLAGPAWTDIGPSPSRKILRRKTKM
jgi:hypothetical protein